MDLWSFRYRPVRRLSSFATTLSQFPNFFRLIDGLKDDVYSNTYVSDVFRVMAEKMRFLYVELSSRLVRETTQDVRDRDVRETTAFRPLSDLTIQGFIVHSWYKHSHQVCVEVKMGQRCQ